MIYFIRVQDCDLYATSNRSSNVIKVFIYACTSSIKVVYEIPNSPFTANTLNLKGFVEKNKTDM